MVFLLMLSCRLAQDGGGRAPKLMIGSSEYSSKIPGKSGKIDVFRSCLPTPQPVNDQSLKSGACSAVHCCVAVRKLELSILLINRQSYTSCPIPKQQGSSLIEQVSGIQSLLDRAEEQTHSLLPWGESSTYVNSGINSWLQQKCTYPPPCRAFCCCFFCCCSDGCNRTM